MIIIRLYIWLESSLLLMRQRTSLLGRVWSMRPEWARANIGGQKEDRNDYIIWLINLLILCRILLFKDWIWLYYVFVPYLTSLKLCFYLLSFPYAVSWMSWFAWMNVFVLPCLLAFWDNKVAVFFVSSEKEERK